MPTRKPNFAIRSATPADISAITTMYRFDSFFHAQGDPERAEFYFAVVKAAGGEVLVAVEGDAVIGHLELLLCQEAPPLGRYGYLETLEVRADRRRRGVGRALVEEAKRITRAAGGSRLETVPEDDIAAALYMATGFQQGVTYLDLDLAVPPEALTGAAPLGLPLPPGSRPWLHTRHIAGRQYPAAFCWARAHLAGRWSLPEAEGTGAWQPRDSAAIILADPWLVHLFLPTDIAPESDEAWPAWQAMLALRGGAREGYVRTVLETATARVLRWPECWPGSTADPFTLLACPLRRAAV